MVSGSTAAVWTIGPMGRDHLEETENLAVEDWSRG